MTVRKKTLWRVPLFCIAAGEVSYWLIVSLLGRFAVVTLPDGTITIDQTRSLLVYGVILLATLLAGGLLVFRGMTRKELLLSASIVVTFGLVCGLIQWAFGLTTGSGAVVFLYLDRAFEWCGFVSGLISRLSDNVWLGGIAGCFTPYLFLLFSRAGRRDEAAG